MAEDGSSRQAGRSGMPVGVGRPGIPSGPRRAVTRRGPNSRWPQYIQFLVVLTLTVLFLFLAISMQRHHFMNGEFYDRSHPSEQ